MRHFHNGAFGITVQQQVSLGVHQDGAPDLLAPVVKVGNAAQAGLDAANHNRHIGIGFTTTLGIDNYRPVRALAANITGSIGVVVANLLVRGIAVNHGVHIAGSHTVIQVRPAQSLKVGGGGPVWLGNNAHSKALGFQHPANHRHTKTGMVHISVAGDHNNVATVPAKSVHFGATGRQKWRYAKTFSPVGSIIEQARGFWSLRKSLHGYLKRGWVRIGASYDMQPALVSKG